MSVAPRRPSILKSITLSVYGLMTVIALMALTIMGYMSWSHTKLHLTDERLHEYHQASVLHVSEIDTTLSSVKQLIMACPYDRASEGRQRPCPVERTECHRALAKSVHVVKAHAAEINNRHRRFSGQKFYGPTTRALRRLDSYCKTALEIAERSEFNSRRVLAEIEFTSQRLAQLKRLHQVTHDQEEFELSALESSQRFKFSTLIVLLVAAGGMIIRRLFRLIRESVLCRERAEESLRVAAMHDTLTSLSNRVAFHHTLRQAMKRHERVQGYKYAVLFLDFDRFKVINDGLGHRVGDMLLAGVGNRLRQHLRGNDTAARFGGDEFVILLDGISGVQDAVAFAERLLGLLSMPHELEGHVVTSTASIGVAFSDFGYDGPEGVIRHADLAMYRAKAEGGNAVIVFDEEMHRQAKRRVAAENAFRNAFEREELELVYQPILSIPSRNVVGFDAQVLWRREDGRTVHQHEILSIATDAGLIVPLGSWLLSNGLEHWRCWQDALATDPALEIGLSLDRQRLARAGLLDEVSRLMHQYNVPSGALRFHIPEAVIGDDVEDLLPTLRVLSSLGVRLIVDGFGTGHALLGHLHRLPVHEVRIERDELQRMKEHPDVCAVICAAIALAHSLDVRVLANGVDSSDQIAQLETFNCDMVQGDFIAPPQRAAEVVTFLQRNRILESSLVATL